MSRASFFYGMSAGFGVGWLFANYMFDEVAPWLVLGAAVSLGIALGFHQRKARREKGRRWRRTA